MTKETSQTNSAQVLTELTSSAPIMYDLVVFSHLRWDKVRQRAQDLRSKLMRDRRIIFVEEPEHAPGTACMRMSSPCAGVTVLRARTAIEAAGFDDAQLAVLQPLLRRSLADRGVGKAVAWFFTPMALPLLKALDAPLAVVYDRMDEEAAFHVSPPQLLQREAELLARADLVLPCGPSLHEAKKKSRHAHAPCFPSAADERLDLGLMASLTSATPDKHWVA